MKRVVSFLLICLTVFLCGCSDTNDELIRPVDFYYVADPISYDELSTVIRPEAHEGNGYDDPILLIRKYLKNVPSKGFVSPYPPGTDIISLEQNGDTVNLRLNRTFSRLTGSDLSIACACLTWTICDHLGVSTIHLSVENGLIDGKESITLNKEIFNLLDRAMTNPEE